ncbi:hypothetical protein LINGRAHAP2_LOCUS21178, partial [Linum grandiflorum]
GNKLNKKRFWLHFQISKTHLLNLSPIHTFTFTAVLSSTSSFFTSSPAYSSAILLRQMADIEPPSFSLDLDFDDEPSAEPCNLPPSPPSPPAWRPLWEEDEEDIELQVMDSEEEDEKPRSSYQLNTTPLVAASGRDEPPQILKRLRRGGLPVRPELDSLPSQNADDDIEDFSSEDDDFVADLLPSRHYNSVGSSSKASLGGSGVFTPRPSAQTNSKLKGKVFDTPASSSLETGHSGLVFPKLTASPLRRFRLNDSDEEPAPRRKPEKVASQSTRQCSAATEQSGRIEDLWKNFRPVQTPALDAFCNEYFQSVKDKDSVNRRADDTYANHHHQVESEQCSKVNDHFPPARHYFFHDDARIRVLVRNRLPHFFPAGVTKARGNEQPSEHLVDYRSQFGGASNANNMEKGSSSRARKRPRKSNAKAESSQPWVDPRTTARAPKDAGRRRVQASGQAAAASGHWFTSPEGRKVYVAKSGQELTGQTAYRQFKRDSGGYRKSKKKSTSKRRKKT